MVELSTVIAESLAGMRIAINGFGRIGRLFLRAAARAGGVPEFRMLMKYPVRMALNPIVATLGWELTNIISGAPIVGIVLSLPDTGPLFINALLNQDMYLAGAMILIYCSLVIIGTFISDMLLMVLDPRIRLESRS